MSTFRGSREANRGLWRGGGRNGAQRRGGNDSEQRGGSLQWSPNNVRGTISRRAGATSRTPRSTEKEHGIQTSTLGKNVKGSLFGSNTKSFLPSSPSVAKKPKDQSWRHSTDDGSLSYQQGMSDLYQTLKKNREKERKDAIRDGFLANPDKPTSLADAITPVGTCQDMCPEFERVERIVQKMVDKCEKTASQISDTRVPYEEHMVKRFRRSAAGYDEQLPSDIRPPLVLQKTLNYLFEEVVGGSQALSSVHKFVWDRTRGIRNDFSIQQVTKTEDLRIAIDCFERIARFHILSLHQLSQPGLDNGGFDHYQEREQLNNTLLSLMYYYDDSRHKLTSPNEAEFRAYCIIFEIQNQRPDIEDRAQNWPKRVLGDPRVQTAMKLYAAAGNTMDKQGPLRPHEVFSIAQGNYGRFWSVVGSNAVSYLMACAAEIYFNLVRSMALEAIWKAYRRGGQMKMEDLILGDLRTALGFDNEDQVQSFCEDHGFVIGEREDGESFLDISSVTGKWLTDSVHRRPQIFSKNLVERKRLGRTLPAVINGLSASQARANNLVEHLATTGDSPALKEMEEPLFFSDGSDGSLSDPKSSPNTASSETEQKTTDAASIDSSTKLPSPMGARDSFLFTNFPSTNVNQPSSLIPQPATVPRTSSTSNEDPKINIPTSNEASHPSGVFEQRSQAPAPSRGTFGQSSILSNLTAKANTNGFDNPASLTNANTLQDQSVSGTNIPTSASNMPSSLFFPVKKPEATSDNLHGSTTQPLKLFSSSSSSPGSPLFTNVTAPSTSTFTPQSPFYSPPPIPAKHALDISSKANPAISGSTPFLQHSVQNTHQPSESPKVISNVSKPSWLQSLTLPPSTFKSTFLPTAPTNHLATIELPKIDPRPKILEQIANTVMRKNDGLLEQFIEYTLGPIVLKAIDQNKLERSREEAARARQYLLRTKYLRKWKDNAWKRGLLRKGKERRRTFAQSMQALAQSTREARSTSRVSSASSNFDEQATAAMPPPSKPSSVPRKRKSLSGDLVDDDVSHNDPIPHQKRRLDVLVRTPDVNIDRYHQPHHKRSRTLGDSSILTNLARISKSGRSFDPKSSNLSHSLPMSESMVKRARRLAPSGPTDTTRTDYFRLKALGVDPDTPTVPLVRKRRMVDLPGRESKRSSRLPTPESRPCRTEPIQQSGSSAAAKDSVSSNPAPRKKEVDKDDGEELFAQMRQVRDAMSESITWFREEREKSARSRSISKSQERSAETEKQKKLREFVSTPSRTELRLRATGANGLFPRDRGKSPGHKADAKGSFEQRPSNVQLRGFAAIGNEYGSHLNGISSSPESGGGGTGASANDAIEL